ncbi:MAG: hypothetical protein NTW03_07740 [Verrucomicrobia bacterium]|nr:hypothetical protein [Verrucomicrobiota bacterium]
MKKIILLIGLLLPSLGVAQSYSVDWFTIDGGGGLSTGGVYTVNGTIGQPDAGLMSGGNFTLQGGFWGVVSLIQTPGAPLLSITLTNRIVTISWPTPADGFLLEQTNRLTGLPGLWPGVSSSYATNSTNISVTLPTSPGNQYFRLRKP